MLYRNSGWETVPFGSLATFRNGINFNKKNFGIGIKIINVKDFGDKSIATFEGLDEVNPEGLVRTRDLLQKDDIVFVRSNGNRQLIGRSLLIPEVREPVTHSAFTIRARITSIQALPRFFAYLFRSDIVRQLLSAYGSGTNISNLNQGILADLQVTLPPLPTQRKIAAILSAYDDLIENNTRRIALLEQMAQLLYREWFVRFRFPGHESARMVESEVGEIPEGWGVVKLGEALELAYGKGLTKENRVPGPYPVYGSSGIVDYHQESFVKGPGIIVGRKGNVGTIFWSYDDFYPIDTVFYVKTAVCLHYVFYNLQNQNFISTDTAVPGLNRNMAYLLSFLLPDKSVLEEFQTNIEPIFRQVENLRLRNTLLRRTRDLLLPRLISGEVDVEQLAICTGA